MESILSESLIDKYITKEVRLNGRIFRSIFEFSQDVEDTHEYIVGFSEGERKFTTKVYIPSLENGMVRRNSNLWYHVFLVVPPLYHKNQYGKIGCMKSVINDSMMCSSASDFMPVPSRSKAVPSSRLMKELLTDEPLDITNIYNWNVIGLGIALIEIFNQKLLFQVKRSVNKSYAGCSGISKAMHTLINAMTRYYSDSDAGLYIDGIDSDDDILANSLSRDDKKGVLLVHPMIKQTDINGMNPIDFCSCNQSLPMLTARIKGGVTVEGVKFHGTPDFPYAEYRKAVPGILHDDPHRVIVSRSVSRAMTLASDYPPFVKTEVNLGVDTVSLPGVLMTDPLNMEDAIVVSKTFADQMGAFKVIVDKFSYPEGSHSVKIDVEECNPEDIQVLSMFCSGFWNRDEIDIDLDAYSKCIVRPGTKIGTAFVKDENGEEVIKDIISTNKVPAIVSSIRSFTMVSDFRSDMTTYKLTYMAYLPLTEGSKVSDLHGNKATISEILPDEKMPKMNGEIMHYIATPYKMKRLAVGAEIEDKLALIGEQMYNKTGEILVVNSSKVYPLESVDRILEKRNIAYTGTVEYLGRKFEKIPRSLRMMVRLDNNPDESLVTKTDIVFDDSVRVSKNSKLGLDLVTLVARGANNLVNELIHHSGNRAYFTKSVLPVMYAVLDQLPEDVETYDITLRIDREVIGSPVSNDFMYYVDTPAGKVKRDFTGTVCDPRCSVSYGIIKYKDQMFIVPPHDGFVELANGLVMIDKIAVMANRLLAEVISEQKTSASMADVAGCISRYHNMLSGMLTGKSGLIRESILPVLKRSTRAVLSPYIGRDPLEIAIPRGEFKKLCRRNPEFAEFYKNKSMCILKRDPVHRNNNFVSCRFVFWDKSTIGVHPALVRILDGDYDGDQVVVGYPSTTLGYNDLSKLVPDMNSWFKGSKQLTNVAFKDVPNALEANRGWTSTFMDPHSSDVLKNPDTFAMLKVGITGETASKVCIKAARDFCVIKDGTALTGALSLRFIFTRQVNDKDKLNGAMELYHAMAQCTLDAKSGVEVPSLDVVKAFSKGSSAAMVRSMKALGFNDTAVIEDLLVFSKKVGSFDNVMSYLVENNPVLAATQRKLSYSEVYRLASRCLGSEKFESGGVMEKLYDYIMDRDKVMPFEYNFDVMEVYNHAKFNHPVREIEAGR